MDSLAGLTLAGSQAGSGVKRGESLKRKHVRKTAGAVRSLRIHKTDNGYIAHSEHSEPNEDGSETVTHRTAHIPSIDGLHSMLDEHFGEEPSAGDEPSSPAQAGL